MWRDIPITIKADHHAKASKMGVADADDLDEVVRLMTRWGASDEDGDDLPTAFGQFRIDQTGSSFEVTLTTDIE